jgi:4-amino-4-deoxy-L-arabinose transferase-like glycosyltransferase
VKFQAVADGENEITGDGAIRLNQPGPPVFGGSHQVVEPKARALLVVPRAVQHGHKLHHAIDLGGLERKERYSQVSIIREVPRKFPRLLWLALPLAYFLYFFHLDAVGLVGPDEPRYASIAREMARSGDWITPRLWGEAWFEKPVLLYWMSGAAFHLHVPPDLAPRLPVALMSVAFLVFYWWILNREFGCRAAWLATLILGTSAGLCFYGQAGVPDLPVTATFSAAMLLSLPWIAKRDIRMLPVASALLGLAVLAKSLPPLAMAAPLALRWRWWRDLVRWRVVLPFLLIALPWHVLCYLRNGRTFFETLFVQHQFGRFTSGALLHSQPGWFYVPVLAGLLLPWSPLLPMLARGEAYRDPRRLFLLEWALFGLLLFSLSVNKLPGYVLPLLPPIAALLAVALHEAKGARAWLVCCALALAVFPIAAPALPVAVANGLSHTHFPPFHWTWLLPVAAAVAVWTLESRQLRLAAVALIATGSSAGIVYLKIAAAPELNRVESARALWQEIADRADQTCVDNINRGWRYRLNYYSVTPLPECAEQSKPLHVVQEAPGPPKIVAVRTAFR